MSNNKNYAAKYAKEILDVVDANNNIIGQANRQEIHDKNLMHRAAHIFVVYDNHVFLQLRSPHKPQFPNLWDTSAAGHVDHGESYTDTAIREVDEELGLKVSPDSNNDTAVIKDLGDLPATPENGFEFVKIYLLEYSDRPLITINKDEIMAGGWFEISQVDDWLKTHPESFAGGFYEIWQVLRKLYK